MRYLKFLLALVLVLPSTAFSASPAAAAFGSQPLPAPAVPGSGPQLLENGSFECWGSAEFWGSGYHDQPGISGMVPDGWTGIVLTQPAPFMCSTQVTFQGGQCKGTPNTLEKLEGIDSLIFMAPDIEKPPLPGKPFDAMIYQQVAVTPGVAYSLSGWITSLCGGSASPNDCPAGYYITKMAGIDATGGTNPLGPAVTWVTDTTPHTIGKWANLRVAATAQAGYITVFLRVQSLFQHHGNEAFADAVRLVRAPRAWFVKPPALVPYSQRITLNWGGDLGPDIPQIPSGAYQLWYDVQYRLGPDGPWQDWLLRTAATSATFGSFDVQRYRTYYFRIRPLAEQPDLPNLAYPNHRFPGDWTQIAIPVAADGIFLPLSLR